jgi:hypothetical protein
MDFTFLFLIILMLMAYQSGLGLIAAGLFVVTLVMAKNKFLMAAAAVGGLALGALFLGFGEESTLIIGGALFLVFILLAWKDDQPGGQPGYPGMGY